MRIEVAAKPGSAPNIKGDLLEVLAGELLENQQYDVTRQVRKTASEVDLHCVHRVTRESIYVECKALREPLSANVLKNLLGERAFHGYSAVWLVSAGPLGKDCRGLQLDWERRPTEESSKLRIYTPERVVDALVAARAIVRLPQDLEGIVGVGGDELGDPYLLLSPYGRMWVVPLLVGGVPKAAAALSAKTGQPVGDTALLANLAATDSSVADLELRALGTGGKPALEPPLPSKLPPVVQVSTGETWSDYRPARPQDFVGRAEAQKEILQLIERIRQRSTLTRVFAITGDSGMGKSSLIAKLRDRVHNKYYRRKFYFYAVDMRAATSTAYVFSCLTEALKGAVRHFGLDESLSVRVSDVVAPLSDPSVERLLEALDRKNYVVCLILDQFEELYSKVDLLPIFDSARALMMSVIAAAGPLAMAFAWKTDATVHQEHPAYYMWHQLSDHRYSVHLRPFGASDAGRAVTLFEKELGEKVRPELKRQLIEISQGFPWLLKKLCIHVYEQRRAGASQSELLDRALDVASLFQRDLAGLSTAETHCLKYIAESSPVDHFEIIDIYGADVVRRLTDRRLVIRSGDRLNLYWDIFQEYVRTGNVPSIPLTYVPSSPSLSTLLRMAELLEEERPAEDDALASVLNVSEKTAGNIIRDLVMFGVAERMDGGARLDPQMKDNSAQGILEQLRSVLSRHALKVHLDAEHPGSPLDREAVVDGLKHVLPTAQHRQKTWEIYGDRMLHWLEGMGLISRDSAGNWVNRDLGRVAVEATRRRRTGRRGVQSGEFVADAPPERAVEALEALQGGSVAASAINPELRNAILVLRSLGLVEVEAGRYTSRVAGNDSELEAVWSAAWKHPTLRAVRDWLESSPKITGREVGGWLNERFDKRWKPESIRRTGQAVLRWARWLSSGTPQRIADYPGRVRRGPARQQRR